MIFVKEASRAVKKIFILAGALALFLAAGSRCQELPDLESETDSEELAEMLGYLRDNPVGLGKAAAEELMLIPWLSPAQALRIRAYSRERRLTDPWRLVSEGIVDRETLERILPYIYIEGKAEGPGRLAFSSRGQRSWSDDTVRAPSPWSNRQRLDYKVPDRWRVFLQTQKDKGEDDWLDYWSGAAWYRDGGARFEAVAGDYQLASGLGLAFGGTGPRIAYPGCFPTPAARPKLSAYTSGDEGSALRGAAGTMRIGGLRAAAGLSWRRVDGKTDSAGALAKICEDGYHQTRTELARKNNTGERLGFLGLGWDKGGAGWAWATGYACGFDRSLAESLKMGAGGSLAGGVAGEPGYLSLELAATEYRQGAISALAGSKVAGTEASLLAYAYGPGYRAPRFNAYEKYGGSDEQGAALFQKTALPLRSTLSSVFHWYRPWSAGATVGHGHGGFLLDLKVDNDIITNLEASCRFKHKEAEEPFAAGGTALLGRKRSRSAKAMLDWSAAKGWAFSADYAASRVRPASGGAVEKGDMLSAGFGWKGLKSLYLKAQSSLYRTDSYDAALYQAEPELLGSGSFHPLFGSGRRDALLVRYTYARRLTAEMKLGYTYREYQGETTRQAELGMQIELK